MVWTLVHAIQHLVATEVTTTKIHKLAAIPDLSRHRFEIGADFDAAPKPQGFATHFPMSDELRCN